MSSLVRAEAKSTPPSPVAWTSVPSRILQRKCACGQHTVAGGECESCRQKRIRLQRRATRQAKPGVVPSIVDEVLRSPGEPLDPATRAFMEPRFGHDFSRVRVHADAKAAESAQAVNALAYTIGRNLVFGTQQLSPNTYTGRELLAHELAHAVQQGLSKSLASNRLKISQPGDLAEIEANRISRVAINQGGKLQPSYQSGIQLARQQSALGTGTQSAISPKLRALAQHELQQKRVYELIEQGLNTSPSLLVPTDANALFRNSCQWIAARTFPTTILTPTHDATTRRAGLIAYFDKLVHFPAIGGDYAEHPAKGDTDHIEYLGYAARSIAGVMSPTGLTLIDPANRPDEQLKQTIIHEVQHAAELTDSRGLGNPPPGRVAGSPGLTGSAALISEGRHNLYQSEFRAYWIETRETSPMNKMGSSRNPAKNNKPVQWTDPSTNQTLSEKTDFKNERQENIFWYIADNYPALQVLETYARDDAYRNMVDNFAQPVGINLVNSVRIQALTNSLTKCTPSMDDSAPQIQAMLQAANALDATDRTFLNDHKSSQPFWSLAQKNLPFQLLARLEVKIMRIKSDELIPVELPSRAGVLV